MGQQPNLHIIIASFFLPPRFPSPIDPSDDDDFYDDTLFVFRLFLFTSSPPHPLQTQINSRFQRRRWKRKIRPPFLRLLVRAFVFVLDDCAEQPSVRGRERITLRKHENWVRPQKRRTGEYIFGDADEHRKPERSERGFGER